MINSIILFSIKNKFIIGLMMFTWIGLGIYSLKKVPVDAVPDITNNQVQIITMSPNLGTEDIEQFVTYPVELAMANLPGVIEIRSISRFGLSVVTIVFEDSAGTYLPRQLVSEKLAGVKGQIPPKFGEPFMGPITTGLGEIFQYTLEVAPEYKDKYTDTDLRTFQDWIVKRQMAMLSGVVEVNSFGGKVKQYEVAIDPNRLKSMGISIAEVFKALESNNENTGGAYIVKNHKANFIRSDGLTRSLSDIENVVVKTENGVPILIKDIAGVRFGHAVLFGGFTKDGKGDAVGGMILMLKGGNSNEVIASVKKRVIEIEKSLPKGITIKPFLDRATLIQKTTSTVMNNLLEGGLIVIFVLVLFLGNFRGGLIVASTIPLSLLFAYIMMNVFGVWSNLMSLGSIDFGIIVDGAVIIVEGAVLYTSREVRKMTDGILSQKDLDTIAYKSSSKMMNAAFFGQLIILIVFLPILTLEGVEGKMFVPMAQTFSFAVIGAMILCLTYVPMTTALFMSKKPSIKEGWGDKFINTLGDIYEPILERSLNFKTVILSVSFLGLLLAIFTFSKMGGEFIPKIDEGDIAMQALLKPGSSLEETMAVSSQIEATILENFPEVTLVVSRIGVAELPTDPMPMDIADMFLILKPKDEWVSAESKEELVDKIKAKLAFLPGVNYEFSQPLELRFNELMTGVRQDVAIKLFGDDLDKLAEYAQKMSGIIAKVEGVADLKVEATKGLPQMTIKYERAKLAQYGLNVQDLNTMVRIAFSGESAGVVFEGERRFDLMVRLKSEHKESIDDLKNLFVSMPDGHQIPLKEVAQISYQDGPMQISREGTNRRTYVGINVRGRDVESVVLEIQDKLDKELDLPPGYYLKYGGTFENLQRAKQRLMVVVPIALVLIFILLYFALKSFVQTMMIYISIPLAAIGGVFSLWVRDIPFSISAGVGFIVLFGVAVLNGLVLISSMNYLKKEGVGLKERILRGTKERIRPIFLTASTDILGFLPMAISSGSGAEVQRPLATVVIGGLLTASILTLIVIPILYEIVESYSENRQKNKKTTARIMGFASTSTVLLVGFFVIFSLPAEAAETKGNRLSLQESIDYALKNNQSLTSADLEIDRLKQLKGTSFDFGKTNIGIEFGNQNGFESDTAFSIEQNFMFPNVYVRKRALNIANIETGKRSKEIIVNDLIKEVKQVWYQLAYLIKVEDLLNYKDKVYVNFLKATKLKYETGAGTLLEKITAEVKMTGIQLDKESNKADQRIYQKKLQVLLNYPFLVSVKERSSLRKKQHLNLSSWTAELNPNLHYLKSLADKKKQETRLESAELLPEFSIAYTNQSLRGFYDVNGTSQYFGSSERFSSFKINFSIPLWIKPGLSRIRALKLEEKKSSGQLKYYKNILKGRYAEARQNLLKHNNILTYYDSKSLKQAELILSNAKKGFESGGISYIEYIQALDTSIAIEKNYLNVLNKYNQSVIDTEHLAGQQ